MAFPRKLLNQGEELILDLNPHWVFLVPSISGLVAAVIVGLVVRFAWNPDPGSIGGKTVYVLVALLVLVALGYFLVKLAVWSTTHFVVTSHRLITGSGVLSKTRREIPLDRVNDVSFHQGILERMVGAGNLTIESAGERGQETFLNVNHPDQVQQQIYTQMELREQRRYPHMAAPQYASQPSSHQSPYAPEQPVPPAPYAPQEPPPQPPAPSQPTSLYTTGSAPTQVAPQPQGEEGPPARHAPAGASPSMPAAPADQPTQQAPPTPPPDRAAGPAEPAPAPPRGSTADQLEQLRDLLQRGLISQAEHDAKRAQILDRM